MDFLSLIFYFFNYDIYNNNDFVFDFNIVVYEDKH